MMNDPLAFGIALTLLGLGGGLMAGMFGIGGGIVIVPALSAMFVARGLPLDTAMPLAVGTSMAVIIPTSLISSRAHHRKQAVDFSILRLWAVPVIVGAAAGSLIASHVAGHALKIFFGIFVALLAVYMGLVPADRHLTRATPTPPMQRGIASVVGLISAMVGIGGGSLTVPTLVACREPMHRAVGTASAVGLLISLPATLLYLFIAPSVPTEGAVGRVHGVAFLILAATTMLAAPWGASLAHRIQAQKLRQVFALVLAVIAAKMVF